MKLKAKDKEAEGSPEEIRDFCKNQGLNLDDFFEQPKPLKLVWLIIPVLLAFVSLIWLTIFSPNNPNLQKFVFLFGCSAGIWLAVSVQMRFKNTWAAVFLGIATFLILLVAFGSVTPLQIFQELKELKK
ncbi:MAG: hypothetical protein AABY51_10310 [Deltaproteobacteria bacterium]